MRGLYATCIAMGLCVCAPAQNTAEDLVQLIRKDDLGTLRVRLGSGAKVEAADSRGTTLLMQAAAIGSPEAVKLLLDLGADAKAKNQLDETALLLAAGDLRKARPLVEKGADVNAKSKLGRTPLMIAAACDGCVASRQVPARSRRRSDGEGRPRGSRRSTPRRTPTIWRQ